MFQRIRTLTFLSLLATAGAAQAQASIDHNKALSGNVSPGDAPGYPITLSQPGHYKLTGNLLVPAGSVGISITAPHVVIDFNGFGLIGPGTCTRNDATKAVSCNQPDNAKAVGVETDLQAKGTVLRNGSIRGFAGYGVLGREAEFIERMHIAHNNKVGIVTGQDSMLGLHLKDSVVELNGGGGLSISMGLIEGSRIAANGGTGVSAGALTVVRNSAVRGNKGAGVLNAAVAGVLGHGNGINFSSTTSLGGNLNNTAPY